MSLIALPTQFRPRSCRLSLAVNHLAHASPYGSSEQVIDLLNDRWMLSCELSENIRADAGWREGFVGALRGKVNTVNLHHFARKVPAGTLRGTPVVLSAALQGAASLILAGTPGATLAAGDMLGASGLLLMVAADCTADATGVITVPLVNRLRKSIAGLTRASTATHVNSTGVLTTAAVDVPRFDYNPVTLVANGLLAEASGTNLQLYSQDFANAAWIKAGVGTGVAPVVTINDGLAPDGTLTAAKIVFDQGVGVTAGDQSNLQGAAATVAGQPYCQFWWLRTTDGSTVTMRADYGGVSSSVGSNLLTVTPVWTRFLVPAINSASNTLFKQVLRLRGTFGTSTFASLHVWSAQFENALVHSSYIRTTSAPVTRAADITVPAIWDKPTAPFRMMANSGVGHLPGMTGALSFDFAEAIA